MDNLSSSFLQSLFRQTVVNLPIILILISAAATAQPDSDEFNPRHPIAKKIVELSVDEQYQSSLALADSMISVYPKSPFGYLLKATIYSARTVDYEDLEDVPALLRACSKTEELCESYFDDPDRNPYYGLYKGMAGMYRVLILHRSGSWYGAIKHLMKAGGDLSLAYKIEPELWDVHYGLGMYHYYVSKNAGILRSIGLISDRRETGLNHIKVAANKGIMTKYAARNSLAWIALENENYEEAVERAQALLNDYPGKRVFLWCLGKGLMKTERYKDAIPVYLRLKQAIKNQERNNRYNDISCLHALVKANFQAGNFRKTMELAAQAKEFNLSEYVYSKKKENLKEIKEYERKALERLTSQDKRN